MQYLQRFQDLLKEYGDRNRIVDYWKSLDKDKKIGLISALMAVVMILWPSGSSLKKKGYDIDLPKGAGKVRIEVISEEELAQLNTANLNFVSKPVNVTTRGGDSHVQLEKMARVSFPIPKNIPKKERINLIGVLLTDDGPVYMVPDYMELKKGIATFETSHFCVAGLTAFEQDQLRELFIERTAATGWKVNACDKDLQGTLKEQLQSALRGVGIDGNDLLGITLKEVFADNSFVQDAIELIDAYDDSKGNPDKLAEKVVEKIKDMAKAKALSLAFEKLKGDKEVDVVDQDLKNKGKYKHTRIKMEGSNKRLVSFLEGELGLENMKKIGTRLGNGEDSYIVAWEFFREIRNDRLKEIATDLIPQIKIIKKGAKVAKVLKEFWASNEMIDMYNVYSRNANSDGRMSNDDWNTLMIRRLNAAKAKFGLTEAEIRKQFEERYRNNRDIERKKNELRQMIKLWEDPRYKLTEAYVFDDLNYDYTMRLTRVHQLIERFRSELVVNGEIPGKARGKTVDETLCEIVEKYLSLWPDQAKFRKWLAKMGYMGYQMQRDVEKLDKDRSWWLVGRTFEVGEEETGEYKKHYSASPTVHKALYTWEGEAFLGIGDVWYKPYVYTFTATLDQEPPQRLEAGDSLIIHASIRMSGPENGWYIYESATLNMDQEDIPMGFTHDLNSAEVRNLVGSKNVGSRYGAPTSGEWDFVLDIPRGRKDDMKAVNFDACGSRTHWIYQWGSIFEVDNFNEEDWPEAEE